MAEVKGRERRRIRKGGKWVEVEGDVIVIRGVEWLKCVDENGETVYYRL